MLIENVGESGQAGVQMQMDGESKEVVVVNGVVRWDVDEMGKCWRVGRVGGERDGLCIGAVDFGAVADLTTLCDSDCVPNQKHALARGSCTCARASARKFELVKVTKNVRAGNALTLRKSRKTR